AKAAPAAPGEPATKGFIRPLTGKERRELEGLDDKLAKAEEAVAMLQERIGTAKVVNSPSLMATACSDLALAQSEVERLYGRWTELSERAGA
ncbi:MAG: ABC transporter ATP-binding protein, partial [Planctomycetes bacterium]|nr:ABC transporter ATP-binding protein [Planctomycetota bacterium]